MQSLESHSKELKPEDQKNTEDLKRDKEEFQDLMVDLFLLAK